MCVVLTYLVAVEATRRRYKSIRPKRLKVNLTLKEDNSRRPIPLQFLADFPLMPCTINDVMPPRLRPLKQITDIRESDV